MGAKIGKQQSFNFNRKKTLPISFQKGFNDQKFEKSDIYEEKKEKSIEVFLTKFPQEKSIFSLEKVLKKRVIDSKILSLF